MPLDSEDDPKALGLIICFPNYDPENKTVFLKGAYQLLDTMLGEKSVALEIQRVEVDRLRRKFQISEPPFVGINNDQIAAVYNQQAYGFFEAGA